MNGLVYPEIATRIFGTPLMMHPGKAASILSAIGGRLVDGGLEFEGAVPIAHVAFERGRPSAARISDRMGRYYDANKIDTLDRVGNVAVIGIEGTLVHKGAFIGMSSGRTSYQGLQTQIKRAALDKSIAGVVFEVDSFGGEVAGAFETASMIAELGQIKPTIAILTDHALSAGYLLASAAKQVIMPPHGRAGSIGVITLHADYSAALAKNGVRVTILAAGEHKADGNPYEPLPKETADRIRGGLGKARQSFAEHVGRFRGSRLTAAAALATEAQDYDGSDAVALGLADAVGNANAAFSSFIAAVNKRRHH
ncbi:signal peptide peptidase SppA [Rhodopseudomonas faecalis]|uniref:Signal peptide peptidase SppA n=1 Tax=Rhodopseudomonas faecalis TaxID=99655 RepID=A0A318TME2_9BRAD|nr:S49 family peptidase [Rhodopseudomonas faecalis]PYF05030.1 signal peptide peptidase SppA [Rhodopseudomonas faecalis]